MESKQPMGQWRNQKIPRDKRQWKHDDPKPVGCSKSRSKREFVAIQVYLKKQEKSQINNLNLHLKEVEKEEQTKSKVSRRKEIIKLEQK